MADNFIDSASNSGASIKTPPTVSSTLAAGGTGTGFDDLVARAYDRMIDFQLRSQVVFRDLADKRPVQQAMPGYAVTFSLYNDLAQATTPLAEVTDLDAAALDDVDQVSVVLKEYGNVVVNKEAHASKKLISRRAIEAHLERKRLEKDLEAYYFD